MSKRRVYLPSETHLALHPPSALILCACGVRFARRPESVDSNDDPDLCLTCNRSRWSRLWNSNRPIDSENETRLEAATRETIAEIEQATQAVDLPFNLTSDTDIGEVVSMIERRQRR